MKRGVWTNEYRLWDHTLKITWLLILLARNNIFPFSPSPATFRQQTMVLSVLKYKPRPLETQICTLENCCITAWFDAP